MVKLGNFHTSSIKENKDHERKSAVNMTSVVSINKILIKFKVTHVKGNFTGMIRGMV